MSHGFHSKRTFSRWATAEEKLKRFWIYSNNTVYEPSWIFARTPLVCIVQNSARVTSPNYWMTTVCVTPIYLSLAFHGTFGRKPLKQEAER